MPKIISNNKNYSSQHYRKEKSKSILNSNNMKIINQAENVKKSKISMGYFDLLETLGKGSYASVMLAIDKRTN